MSKCGDGSDQDARDDAGVERSGRVLGGGRPRFVLEIRYTSTLSLYIDKERSLKGQMTNRMDEPRRKENS